MRFSHLLIPVTSACLLAVPVLAQTADSSNQQAPGGKINFDKVAAGESTHNKTKRFWVGVFDGTGMAQTCIKLDSIVSVSLQSYSLDGAVAVTECTIDTVGNNSIRIYGSRSDQVKQTRDRLSNTRELIDSKSDNLTRYPGKKFPEGAYSHNIEFQLETAEQVKLVYQSILNAWVRNEGCIFRIN